VARVSAVDSRFEALRTTTTPLVGRDEEIELLIRRWQQARGGDGCVVLISGEPGIGKSRVVQSILEHIQNEQHVRLRYFCSPHHQDTALYSIIRQLERTTKFRREDTPQQRLAKLEAVLALATNDLSEAIPLVAEMLSIQIGDRYSSLDLSPRQKKKRLFGVFLAQLEGLAAQRPVLIVFEDVQWIDPTTRELMDMAVERATALRVLLIVTFRTEFTPPWVGRPHVTLLSLSRLSLKQRAEMILQVTGGKALPQEIANELIDRTDGIPLFIEELTKSVVETGALVDAGDRYTVNGPVTPLAIPLSLHASLQARLSQWLLTREVAQVSAALGRSFSHELISAVTSIPQPQLDSTLAKLVSTELIFQSGSPPDAEYTFKHALVQDAAYSTLLRGPRRELHCRITAVLEDRFPEIVKTQPELMARHCVEAGFIERAVDYRLKAGQRAVARSAMTEAVAQLGKGLDLVSDIADATGRQRLELDLQVMLGNTLIATKGYAAPEPSAAFARARQLCEGLGRPAQFGQVLLGEFILRLNRGELRKAEHQAAEIRDLGETSNEVKWKRAGSAVSGNVCFWLGKFIDARAHCEKALSLRDPMHRGFAGSPEHGQGLILINLCKTLACLGYVDQANSRRDEAIAEARRRRSPFSIAGVLANAWHADWAIGASRAAERTLQSAEEILAIAHDQGFQFWLGVGSVMQGWSLATLGQAMEGIPLLLNGLALCRTVGTNLGLPFFLTILAEVYGHSARPEEGFDCLEEAVNLTRTTQWRSAEAEMHRLRGTLLLAMNERAAAEESLRHALAVARRQTARLFELRAAASLALLWRDQGKRPEARDLLAPIYGWFTEGLDTPVLQDAKALLDELASA
jgi:tetratricopeptide (TPR) repeat protein